MKNKKRTLIMIVAVMLAVAALILGYFWYESAFYVKTKDARIASPTVTVTPQISGRLSELSVTEGDVVTVGERLAVQDTSLLAVNDVPSASGLEQGGALVADKREILSPVDGTVVRSTAVQGQIVSPGQSLFMISETGNMYVSANIEETEVAKLKKGQKVDVTIDALDSKTYEGRVQDIGHATVSTFSVVSTQSSSGNFTKVTQLVPIKIRLAGIDEMGLVPGMSVEIAVHLK